MESIRIWHIEQGYLESFQTIWKVAGASGKFPHPPMYSFQYRTLNVFATWIFLSLPEATPVSNCWPNDGPQSCLKN